MRETPGTVPAGQAGSPRYPAFDHDAAVRRRRAARRRRWIAAGVAVLVVGGGTTGYLLTRSSGPRYRTAEVSTGDVAQTVDATGSVASVSRDDAAFSVSGTVAGVEVAVGDTVTAGQTLATLDTGELAEAVTQAQDAVAQAQQRLADDLETQTTGVASTATDSSGGAAPMSATADAGTAPAVADQSSASGTATVVQATAVVPTAGVPTAVEATPAASVGTDLAALQQAVEDAQAKLLAQYEVVNAALADAQAAMDDQATGSTATCAAFLSAADGFLTDAAAADAADTEAAATEAAATDEPTNREDGTDSVTQLQAKLEACTTALGVVQDGQSSVAAAQQALLDDAKALDDAVAALVAAQQGGSGTDQDTAPGGQTADAGETPDGQADNQSDGQAVGDGGMTAEPNGSAGGGTQDGQGDAGGSQQGAGTQAVTITAEQILADQAAIDEAEANLAVAQANADRAELTSRIDGTVAAVDVQVGTQAEAASTAITVLGDGGYLVETTAPLTQTMLLDAGQAVTVTVTGSTAPITGTVSRIGIVNQSQTSTPSYTVTVALDADAGSLFEGSSAQLAVSVASSTGVTVVPTSAVTATGNDRTVQVLAGDGTVTVVPVEVGAVGPAVTEIVSGLDVGQQVVLADLSQAVTTSSDDSDSGGLSGLGGDSGGTVEFGGEMSFPQGGELPSLTGAGG